MDKFLDNLQQKEEDDFYKILGCDEQSSTEQICAEFKAKVLTCHPDRNQNNPEAANLFVKIQRAKEVLSNPQTRTHYDVWRKMGIGISFDDWSARKGFTSIHWINEKAKNQTITESDKPLPDKVPEEKPHIWTSDQSDILRSFRAYNI